MLGLISWHELYSKSEQRESKSPNTLAKVDGRNSDSKCTLYHSGWWWRTQTKALCNKRLFINYNLILLARVWPFADSKLTIMFKGGIFSLPVCLYMNADMSTDM